MSPWNYQLVYKYAMYLPSVSWARKYALPQHHWASIHLTGIFYTVLLGQGTFWADFSWTLGPPRGRGYPYISCFLYSMETTINLLHISQHNKKVPSCDLFQEWMPNLSQIYQPRSNTHHEVVSVSIPLDLHHELPKWRMHLSAASNFNFQPHVVCTYIPQRVPNHQGADW